MADYQEAPLATRPKTLDPNEYFNLSKEYRRAEENRAALRAKLKREYLLQLNNPHRKELIVSGYLLASNVTLETGLGYLLLVAYQGTQVTRFLPRIEPHIYVYFV